jgi:hypothetical protein
MRPLKYKELLPLISQRTGHSQAVVETLLMKAFWPEVRRQLSTLKHPEIHILNLGRFSVKTEPLKNRMSRRENLLLRTENETSVRKLAIRKDAAYELELMKEVLLEREKEKERKRVFKEAN